jgi:hypothetical protein
MSKKLVLDTAISSGTDISEIRVADFSDHPINNEISFRVSFGFEQGGRWVEKKDRHFLVTGATYTTLVAKMRDESLLPEEQILRRVKATFPGTIANA